jgi:hypothetical protein
MRNKVKEKTISMKDAKLEAARLGLQVNSLYDKRFINTWLYTIGQPVEPVKRKLLTHVPKKVKVGLTLGDFIKLARETNQ